MNNTRPQICERLCQIRRQRYGLRGKSRFAKDLDISPSTYDRYERDRIPPPHTLVKAARLTGTRLEWLLTGDGLQAEISSDIPRPVEHLLERIRELLVGRPDLRTTIEHLLEHLWSSPAPVRTSTNIDPHDTALIPIVGSTAAGMARFWEELETAATGSEADARLEIVLSRCERQAMTSAGAMKGVGAAPQERVALIQLAHPDEHGLLEFLAGTNVRARYPRSVAWRIDGDSMWPRFQDGDLVITSSEAPAASGHPCVARQRGQIGVNCKLYQEHNEEISLIPVNEHYPTQRLPRDHLLWAQRVLFSVRLR